MALKGQMITWRQAWEEIYKVNFDSYNAAIEKRLVELGLNPKVKPRLNVVLAAVKKNAIERAALTA
jgi:hypothetical protein